jgi:DNA replication protein DnaC
MFGMSFANYRGNYNAEAVAAVREWVQKRQGWIVLCGGPGRGKTHLLAAAANQLLDQGQRALYVIVPDLLDHLREGIETGVGHQRFEDARGVDFLLLDDLGAEQSTPWAEEKVFQLVNHRYVNGLPMLVASNVGPDELASRVASRLRDRALSRVMVMEGPDYRQSDARAGQSGLGA